MNVSPYGDVVELITPGDVRSFEQFYDIYHASIAPREQKPREVLRKLMGRPDYRLIIARREQNTTGVAVVYVSQDQPIALLEYLAIDAAHRGKGLGAFLFKNMIELLSPLGSTPAILCEVEAVTGSADVRLTRSRRQAFYRRLGCERIEDCRYILPLPGDGPPPEMDLLVYRHNVASPIRRDDLRRWIGQIYQHVYDLEPCDPRIDSALQDVCDPVVLL